MKRLLSAGLIALTVALAPVTRAQYTADFQTNIISGVTSNWSGNYCVGSNTYANVLLVRSSGVLNCSIGVLGWGAMYGDNTAVITDTGSVWNCTGGRFVAGPASGNSLIISNGGKVISYGGVLGWESTTSNSTATVTGLGSVWDCRDNPYFGLGVSGSSNSLLIANGAQVNASGLYVTGRSNSAVVSGTASVLLKYDVSIGETNNNFVIRNGGVVTATSNAWVWGYYHSVLVSDTGSTWNVGTNFYIGYGTGNRLVFSNGARVFNRGPCYVGYPYRSASNNTILVTDTGTVWSNYTELYVGYGGPSNSLVISNGGRVANNSGGYLGYMGGDFNKSSGNQVLVTGPGSTWGSPDYLYVGYFGSDNSLVVSNGGRVACTYSIVGLNGSNSNSVRVVDGGVWSTRRLEVGRDGRGGSLVIVGGSVSATNAVIGFVFTNCTHFIQMNSGDLAVTNLTGNAVLEVRGGRLLFNGGTIRADRFVMTNSCAQFIRTGGTLIYGTAVLTTNLDADADGMANGWEQAYGLDPLNAADVNADNDGDGFTNLQEFQAGTNPTNASSAFRVLSLESTNNDILVTWLAGGGRTNVVQSAPDLTGSYSNVSPNIILTNVTGDLTTNFLDTGGATNGANRYYRIRLVP